MVSFEIFVKAMLPSLSELKVLPSFCFAFKIPDDVAASNIDHRNEFLILSKKQEAFVRLKYDSTPQQVSIQLWFIRVYKIFRVFISVINLS